MEISNKILIALQNFSKLSAKPREILLDAGYELIENQFERRLNTEELVDKGQVVDERTSNGFLSYVTADILLNTESD